MFLPLFPLELVPFPGENIPLHIFEPRYKQLIGECRQTGGAFGIPSVVDGNVAEYGSKMKIIEVLRTYETGEMDIIAQAVGTFRILEFQENVPNRLYSGGEIEEIPSDASDPDDFQAEVLKKYEKLKAALDIDHPFELKNFRHLSFAMACHLQMPIADKLEMLAMAKESDRLEFVSRTLDRVLPLAVNAKENYSRVRKNGNSKPVQANPTE